MSDVVRLHKEIAEKMKKIAENPSVDLSENEEFFDLVEQNRKLLDILLSAKHKVLLAKEIASQLTKSDGRKHATDFLWLTVNPDPLKITPPQKFFNITNNFSQLKTIGAIIYTFEQRSEDNSFNGIHLHALIKRNGKPSQIIKSIHSSFDSFVGIPSKHIKYVWIEQSQCRSKFDYMMGKKQSGKMSKVVNDDNFRDFFGLKKVYQRGDSNAITC